MTKNPWRLCAARVKNLSLLILFSPNLNFILNLGRQRDVLRRVAVFGFRELDFDAVRPQRVDDRTSAVKADRHAPFAGFARQSGYALLPSRTRRHLLIQIDARPSPCLPRRRREFRINDRGGVKDFHSAPPRRSEEAVNSL